MGWIKPYTRAANQPPDLDEALKRLYATFKTNVLRAFKKQGAPIPPKLPMHTGIGGILVTAFLAALVLWALSGIFIVDPAEQAAILRFGKYVETVGPGPHWIPRFISSKIVVNVDRVSDFSYSAHMLTQDENLVSVALVVQYRIGDLEAYLFNVADPVESLQQATSSALRQVVGNTTLDKIITEGREAWGNSVQQSLVSIVDSYKTGIVIVNVSPQPARAPESVQDAFDDAIKAQEDEKRFKEQAGAYAARVLPIAQGNANRILAEAKAFAQQVQLRAEGDVAEFVALLSEYVSSPDVTSQRMYLDTMQRVLSRTTKIVIDNKTGNLLYLPLDKLVSTSLPNVPSSTLTNNAAVMNDSLDVTTRGTTRAIERFGRDNG